MAQSPNPNIGDWYTTLDKEAFEIVAVDNDDDTIEIQYFDGTVAEWDLETWMEMEISTSAPPEDWSGSLDIAREDYGVDLERHCADSQDVLSIIDREL
ncbi:MAG: hypothetical protein GXP22_05880 [Gammaproteobacteria bacterium]|nr:hypothetical protein [Gammaproteobacteria bacterium]